MCDALQVMDGEIIFAVTLQIGCEQSKSAFVMPLPPALLTSILGACASIHEACGTQRFPRGRDSCRGGCQSCSLRRSPASSKAK